MNIQIATEQEKIENDYQEVKRIVIDGVKDDTSSIRHKHLFIEQEDTRQKMFQCSADHLKKHFDCLILAQKVNWCEYPLNISVGLSTISGDEDYIWISFQVNYLEWDKPYSISEFVEIHKKLLSKTLQIEIVEVEDDRDEGIGNFFYFEIIITDLTAPIQQFIDLLLHEAKRIHILALEILENNFNSSSVSFLYKFPKEIRSACNQYLVYFSQFLLDLGIEAYTSITESEENTLFTVTPKDKKEALENIQSALSVYLEASSENVIFISQSNEIAHIQWKANILHLESQIEMSKAIIQAKDQTIQALTFANFQLVSMLPKENKNANDGSEEILGGIASVDDVKFKGVTLKLPEIIRRLRRRFK
jgi:hypothetical protein